MSWAAHGCNVFNDSILVVPDLIRAFLIPCLGWPGGSQREAGRFARIDSRESIRRNKKKTIPDPPTLAFLEKARVFPQKSKGFSLRGTPEILGKGRKSARKSKENRKTKKARKSKKARIGGSGILVTFKRFARIASDLRFAMFIAAKSASQKRGFSNFSSGTLK